jgi:hypothetical protein
MMLRAEQAAPASHPHLRTHGGQPTSVHLCDTVVILTHCAPFITPSRDLAVTPNVTNNVTHPTDSIKYTTRPPRKIRSGLDLHEAGDRSRTGDLQLGKLTLYQLSYARNATSSGQRPDTFCAAGAKSTELRPQCYLVRATDQYDAKWGGRDLNPRLLRCERSALAS